MNVHLGIKFGVGVELEVKNPTREVKNLVQDVKNRSEPAQGASNRS